MSRLYAHRDDFKRARTDTRIWHTRTCVRVYESLYANANWRIELLEAAAAAAVSLCGKDVGGGDL